jgi:cytochrome c oxidase subunit 3
VTTATFPEVDLRPAPLVDNGGKGPGGGSFDGLRGPGGDGKRAVPPEAYRLGMWFALGGISMLFVAFTSAYIYRQGLSFDWQPMPLVPILWMNTTIILLSSATFELSRRALKRNAVAAFERWLTLTTALGIAFLAGQLMAWRQLTLRGIFVATNPHSSFFYVLTGTHGVHLLGGVVALVVVLVGAFRGRCTSSRTTALDVTATYWHFMGGLWVYLFMLLFLWR